MKRKIISIPLFIFCVAILSCSGKKETAASIGQKWCDLNGKVYKAENDAARMAAKMKLKEYENKMEEKYKDDKDFMKEIETEAEKCEDASEGR